LQDVESQYHVKANGGSVIPAQPLTSSGKQYRCTYTSTLSKTIINSQNG